MKKRDLLFGLCCLLLFYAVPLRAQPDNYRFRRLDINQGLSHNQVTCFLKDKRGFLWIGTASGLNRFDGYTVKVFRNDSRDSTSLASNSIGALAETPDGKLAVFTAAGLNLYDPKKENFERDVITFYKTYSLPAGDLRNSVRDRSGHYWFLHETKGAFRYNPEDGTTIQLKRHPADANAISSDSITSLAQAPDGSYWVTHANGILEKIRLRGGMAEVVLRRTFLKEKNNGTILDYRLLTDSDGDLWIFVINDNQGLYHYKVSTETLTHIHKGSRLGALNTNLVSGIAQDDNGLIWIGTDHGGVNILDKSDFSVRYVMNRPEDTNSLGQNSINALYKDDDGMVWIGTFKKGVSYYHDNIFRFPLYKHSPLDLSGLPYGDVNRFVEDDDGNLWIGTNGGGLIYFDRKKKTFRQYRHEPGNAGSLSSDVIVSLCIDHEKKLWIGTYYGGLNCYDGKRFIRYSHDPEDPGSLSDVNVWEIFEDSRKRLWIGTLHGGLDLFDRKTRTFSHYRVDDPNSIQSNYVAALAEDREGNLWIGTVEGIDVLSRTRGRFFHYESEKSDPGSLSDNSILDIREDPGGRIWIGTHGGLNMFDPTTKRFRSFKESDGLPHNSVLTILCDGSEGLWLSTPNGISNAVFSKDSAGSLALRFKNYDEADGLQGKQFNENAALRTRQGELIFGGANGFNIFRPDELRENKKRPTVLLSDLLLHNRSVKIGEQIQGTVILKDALPETREIVLPPALNVFSMEFAALNYFHPEKNEYQYKLEGFKSEWVTADAHSRKVTFTNLDPGEYVFSVRASNNDGYWNEKGTSLKIVILPPFWKTKIAFAGYIALIITGLLITRKLIQQRERLKFAQEQERQEAIRMHELDMMKIRFFTNVSHEFRTPLTLILTPLEKMMRQSEGQEQHHQFELIQRNARRLLNLVNQLLDFRKLEEQEIRFNPSEGDLVHFIEETVYSFSDLWEKKDIRLTFHSTVASLETIFDQDKVEKILFNLLSNAFKFTPEHGAVEVSVALEEDQAVTMIVIRVSDTGIGIPPDKLDKIFERFFQNDLPRSLVNQGSGIGLSITREFTKIHGGTIGVISEVGKGSCFTVRLPLSNVLTPAAEVPLPAQDPDAETVSGKPVLLLVEDNEDFRFYLKDNLRSEYRIEEARNGLEGWNKVMTLLPDLVVSDIMMPEMNGIELCRTIKGDQRVSHTPVILLTARTAEEQKLEGFGSGADDYITKPFNFEILVARIRNLIHQREQFHKSFPRQLDVKASELKITSQDEKLIERAIRCVEDNVSNPDFSVEDLSHELGISRAHFYKKIMALTGKSPLEFIRTIRLQQAAQLLDKSQLTVAEVAYKVGFNNPKYFARYFKEQYHVLPSLYAAEKRKRNT